MTVTNVHQDPDALTLAITVELDVLDRADALAQAQKLVKAGRPATLYEDGVPLGQISYSPAGFWTVSEDGSRVA